MAGLSAPTRYCSAVTANVRQRQASHNGAECVHTAPNRPWELGVLIAFRDEARAMDFERYLKSGSGYAFATWHLRPTS